MNAVACLAVLVTAHAAAVHEKQGAIELGNVTGSSPVALVAQKAVNYPLYAGVAIVAGLAIAGAGYLYMKKETASEDVEAGSKENTAAPSTEEMIEQAKERFGAKFAADGEVVQILQTKAETFAEKLKTLVTNEMNSAAGSVGKALESEDCASILEWDSTISANLPSLSVLLAGLLVPVNLSINYACHCSQVFLVLLPIFCVTAWAEYADRSHDCAAIPGLRLWARVTGLAVFVVLLCRVLMMKRLSSAQTELRIKSEVVRAKVAHLEKDFRDLSLAELRELFALHASSLQQAVICESKCTSSVLSHLIGFGTLVWVLSTFYNTYLYFGFMFVPGVVAFHPDAKDSNEFCGAWVTVCASKVAMLVAVLFLFMNLVTVALWVLQSVLNSSAVSSKISMQARLLDSANLGIPAGQLLVKAFLFRAESDVLTAHFATSMRERSELAQVYADTESRLNALKKKVSSQEGTVEKMQHEIDSLGGGSLDSSVQRMSEKGLDFEAVRGKGLAMVEEARQAANAKTAAATDEIEKLSERVQEIIQQITESESFKSAQASASSAAQQAQASALEAAEAANQAASQAASQVAAASKDVKLPFP